ncbi:protein KRBA1 [Gracilinanus agilis]|uniref:protein KRBA1 n=1 Tax=Gracilinanus agilis TaxID=191870 RepID=UPI001CFE91C4|nr:protein KRBA1 [Gracilinanus agilis]
MRENYETLVSLGTAQLLPLSAFLSLTEPQEDMGDNDCSDGEWERPGGGFQGKELEISDAGACADTTQRAQALDEAQSSGGAGEVGQHQSSLHLNALVRLVKEIPEFLFGETKAMDTPEALESKESGSEGSRLSLAAAMTVDTSPLQGLLNCLPEIPISRPALAFTPAGSSASSSQGDGDPELRSPELAPHPLYPYEPAAKISPLAINRNLNGKEDPETSASQPNTPGSAGSQEQKQLGTTGQDAVGSPSKNSPLQGLINCLKEILVQGPQHTRPLANGPLPQSSPGDIRLMNPDQQPQGPPWAVKAETVSENSPLQGLLNCLKEIPETQARCAALPGRGVQQRDSPGTWQKDSGVKMERTTEDAWAQSPQSYIPDTPTPGSCELSALTHSSSTSSSVESDGNLGLGGPEALGWAPLNQAGSAQTSPLEALETYLKDIPLNRSLRPQPPSNYWCLSPGQGETVQRKSDPRARKWHMEAVTAGSLPSLGPHGCVKDLSAQRLGHLSTPSSFSSASSTDGDVGLRSPEGSWGPWCREASPLGSSPLQGLENCLKEISTSRPHLSQTASSLLTSGGDGILRRADPRSWASDKEGLGGEPHDSLCPRQGGKEASSESLNLGSPQSRVCSSFAFHRTGDRDKKTTDVGPRKCLGEGIAPKPSPLRCLENSLRGILAMRPLRFTCLASPSLSSGSSPRSIHGGGSGSSSSSSSSSSSGGSEGEDPRLEPELWRTHPKECPLLSIPRGPASQASSRPGPLTSSSDSPTRNRDQRRMEPGDWRALNAALKAEETSGCSPRIHGEDMPAETSHGPPTPSSTEMGPSAAPEEAADVPAPCPSSGGPEVQGGAERPKAVPGQLRVTSPEDATPATPDTKAGPSTGLAAAGTEAIPQSSPPEIPKDIQSWGGSSALTSQETLSPPRPDRGNKRLCSLGEPAASCSTAPSGSRIPGSAETPNKAPRLALPAGAAAAPPASCQCGDAFRGELRSLGAALTEQLSRLSSTLATLSQDVSAMKKRVRLLGRDLRSQQRLGRGARPWTPCRRYHRGCLRSVRRRRRAQQKPAQRQPPHLGEQPRDLGVGDAPTFLQRETHMVPQLPPDAPPGATSPFGPHRGASPCSLLLPSPCAALPTVRSPQRRREDDQSPPTPPTAGSASQIAPPPSPEEGFRPWQETEPCPWRPTANPGTKGAWSQQAREPCGRISEEVTTQAQHGGPG